MRMADALVETAALGKKLGGRTVLAGLDLRVAPGERVGLVGANGGGKTTTLRLIAGLLRPDAGEGRVLGAPLDGRQRPPASRFGYMGQRLSLYPELSVRENLDFRASIHGLRPNAVADSVERHGLTPVVNRRVGALSGGWARRAQFAASVLHRPALLLLDEPTAGLDIGTRGALWGWLDALAAEQTGVVISTHDLIEAERLDTLVLYHEGTASMQRAPAALCAELGAPTLEAAVLALAGGNA